MARKKYIDNNELLKQFEEFLEQECSNDMSLFKIPKFGEHLRANGFPNVADTTLRRNAVFRELLAERKAKYEEEEYQVVITYKTIDVDSFMATNRTPNAIRTALTELNQSYKRIVEAALEYKDIAEKLQAENEVLKTQNGILTKKNSTRNDLEEENKKLHAILKTSVYPEIANELLKEEGILQSNHQVITDEFMVSNVLTADSEIVFHEEKTSDCGDLKKANKVVAIKDLLDSKIDY